MNTTPELLTELTHKTGRLLVVRSVSEGARPRLEREFTLDAQRALRRWWRGLAKEIEPLWPAMRAQANAVKASRGSARAKRRVADELLRDLLQPLVSWGLHSTERRAMQRTLREHSFRAYDLGAVDALRAMGFLATSRKSRALERRAAREEVSKVAEEIVFELTDGEIIDALLNRPVVTGAGLSHEVVKDARILIRDKLYLGTTDVHDLAKEISSGAGIPEWRGLKIARTETQVAYNQATFDEYKRSKVKRKMWVDVGDLRERDAHLTNGAQGWIPMDEAFADGAMHPGDPSGTGGVFNCRCGLQADLADPTLMLEPWAGGPLPIPSVVPPSIPGKPPAKKPPAKPVVPEGVSEVGVPEVVRKPAGEVPAAKPRPKAKPTKLTSEQWAASLSEKELAAVRGFTGADYSAMRICQNTGRLCDDFTKELIASLESAAKRSPAFKGQVYRGLHFNTEDEFARFVAGVQKNKGLVDKGFTSTSADIKVARGFAADTGGEQRGVLMSIKSKRGMDLSKLSGYQEEKEVVLRAKAKLKFTGQMSKDPVTDQLVMFFEEV